MIGKLFFKFQIYFNEAKKIKIKAFNTNLLVENYAIKERTAQEIKTLGRIKALRKIELFFQKTSRELSGELMKKENVHELVS